MPNQRLPLALVITLLSAAELLSYRPFHVPITQWEERMSNLTAGSNQLNATKDPILFVRSSPTDSLPSIFSELDAMMLAQNLEIPTANGYSGNIPAYFGSSDYCMTAASRLANAARYRQLTSAEVSSMLKRLVILPPNRPCSDFAGFHPYQGPLPDNLFSGTSITVVDQTPNGSDYTVTIEISNHAQSYLPALSTSNEPVQLSWQFVQEGQAAGAAGWTTREPLGADVPPGGTYRQQVRITAPHAPGHYVIAFSLVQDGVAWFHDKGMSVALSKAPIDVH